MYPLFIFCNINREIVLEILVEGLWESFGNVMKNLYEPWERLSVDLRCFVPAKRPWSLALNNRILMNVWWWHDEEGQLFGISYSETAIPLPINCWRVKVSEYEIELFDVRRRQPTHARQKTNTTRHRSLFYIYS